MEIIIANNNTAAYFLEINKIVWRTYARKNFIYFTSVLILGLFLLAFGIYNGYDSVSSKAHYFENTGKLITEETFYNYHITFGLGIGFISVFLYFVYIFFREKKQFFASLNKVCDRHIKSGNNFTLRINDESVLYQDFELTREEKWSIFSSYRIDKDYLFLFRDTYHLTSTAIPIKQLVNNNLPELLKILQKNLIEKK